MKQISIIVLIIFQSCSILSQDATAEKKGYKILPDSLLDENTLIEIVFNQINMDYWEYRSSQQCIRINDCPPYLSDCYNYKDTCPYTIILNGGGKLYNKDSIEKNSGNITNGFIKPSNEIYFYYFVTLKENKYQIINRIDSLLTFLCPLNTLEKALYYSLLKEYSFGAGITYTSILKSKQNKIYYNKRENIYEFIYVSNANESIVSKRKGAILYYPEYYLRINENGEIYLDRIGTKKYRDKKFGQETSYYKIP